MEQARAQWERIERGSRGSGALDPCRGHAAGAARGAGSAARERTAEAPRRTASVELRGARAAARDSRRARGTARGGLRQRCARSRHRLGADSATARARDEGLDAPRSATREPADRSRPAHVARGAAGGRARQVDRAGQPLAPSANARRAAPARAGARRRERLGARGRDRARALSASRGRQEHRRVAGSLRGSDRRRTDARRDRRRRGEAGRGASGALLAHMQGAGRRRVAARRRSRCRVAAGGDRAAPRARRRRVVRHARRRLGRRGIGCG